MGMPHTTCQHLCQWGCCRGHQHTQSIATQNCFHMQQYQLGCTTLDATLHRNSPELCCDGGGGRNQQHARKARSKSLSNIANAKFSPIHALCLVRSPGSSVSAHPQPSRIYVLHGLGLWGAPGPLCASTTCSRPRLILTCNQACIITNDYLCLPCSFLSAWQASGWAVPVR